MNEPDLSYKHARLRGDLDDSFDTIVMGSWRLFEPCADTSWQRRGEAHAELKARLTAEMLEQAYRFHPQTTLVRYDRRLA